MATTTVSDAYVFPQGPGTGAYATGSEDDALDGAALSLLAEHSGGAYVRSGMGFTRDNANNQIDVGAGFAYIKDDSTSTANQRSSGGKPQVQSAQSTGYDTETPADQYYLVILPTTASVGVTDNTASDIWLNITSVGSNNAVELRSSSGGGTTSAPSDTFLKLGRINDNNSGDPLERTNDRKGDPSRVHLQTNTPSGVGSTTFTSGINESFDKYVIEVSEIVPASDGVQLELTFSNDGGSTWQTGASAYVYHTRQWEPDGNVAGDSSAGASFMKTIKNVGNAAGEGGELTIELPNPSGSTVEQMARWEGMGFYANSSEWAYFQGGGTYTTAEKINGVRLQFQSGNISSGRVSLYGVIS